MPAKPAVKKKFPPQTQSVQPGRESKMVPQPKSLMEDYKPAGKLKGKVALITGGDSGIGRAVAIGYAKEGADVAILYLEEKNDANITKKAVEKTGRTCLLIEGDAGDADVCKKAVKQVVKQFGRIDILVNNAAEQHPQKSIADITPEQLERTFRTNVFAMFYLTQAALPHMGKNASIINTASVTAFRGSPGLLDYSATKGAITSFTRSLSGQLVEKGIRVNAVAPGPIWTPLIPSTFDAKKVSEFGSQVPMQRAGQPDEVAPAFIFLASQDASYITGQTIHPNGGEIVNS